MTLILPMDVQVENHVNRQLYVGRMFTQRLRHAFGRRLSCVWGNEDANDPAIRPGRWHVQYDNPMGPNSYFPITAPNGDYREPGEDVIDFLREHDMHREGRIRELSDERKRAEQDRAVRVAEAKAERIDEITGRIKAYDNPGISFNTNTPWSARVNGGEHRRRREA